MQKILKFSPFFNKIWSYEWLVIFPYCIVNRLTIGESSLFILFQTYMMVCVWKNTSVHLVHNDENSWLPFSSLFNKLLTRNKYFFQNGACQLSLWAFLLFSAYSFSSNESCLTLAIRQHSDCFNCLLLRPFVWFSFWILFKRRVYWRGMYAATVKPSRV